MRNTPSRWRRDRAQQAADGLIRWVGMVVTAKGDGQTCKSVAERSVQLCSVAWW